MFRVVFIYSLTCAVATLPLRCDEVPPRLFSEAKNQTTQPPGTQLFVKEGAPVLSDAQPLEKKEGEAHGLRGAQPLGKKEGEMHDLGGAQPLGKKEGEMHDLGGAQPLGKKEGEMHDLGGAQPLEREEVEIEPVDIMPDTTTSKNAKTDKFLKTTFICLSIAIFGASMAAVKINQGTRV